VTDDNRRRNIDSELSRSREALAAAQHLLEGGFYRDSISRTCYVAFHLVRAMLLADGLQSRTHAGAIQLFSLHFVQPGVFPAATGKLLSRLQSEREDADYESHLVYERADAEHWLATVAVLQEQVLAELARRGWLS